jgi:hypothetical protein
MHSAGLPRSRRHSGEPAARQYIWERAATDLIPPEQADNVLYVYYWGTAAASFFGGTPGPTPAPLNYLQIYSEDIVYAEAHASGPLVQVVETGGSSMFTTAQDVLNLASQKLFQIAEPALPLWPFPF